MAELFKDGTPDRKTYYWIAELHRREWERYVGQRDKPVRLMPQVLTCECECHDEVRRTVLVVGSVILTSIPKPWDLHQ